ncbi:MAG: hypothetical protein M3417_11175 [Actinomycetota bacterium]|nr:hypothetical protein [Actinomycetota bacterium]
MGVATVAAVGTTIAVAEARIPGVGNGLQQSTDSPDLRSVNIDAGDLRRVKYCFDQPLNATPAATGFLIQTYDSKRFIQSTSAAVAAGEQNCVQAIMGSGADLNQGTIGSVQGDAVADAAGRRNVPSSEPLGGSAASPVAGRTTGPDLIGAVRDLDDKSIVFTFDENLDGGAIAPASFAFVDDKGFVTRGASLGAQGGNGVRVRFTETAGGGTVAAAAGAFSDAGAVRDAAQSGVFVAGTPLSTPSATGAITFSDNSARTKLASVAGDGARQLRLAYNNSVNVSGAPARIVAILDDGTSVPASKIENVSAANEIRATFQAAGSPDITADPTALVRVVDTGAAVVTRDAEGLGSLPATIAAGTPKNAPGFTNGPDMLAAAYDRPGSRVFYVFDENLAAANSASFFVTAPSGSSSSTTGSNTTNGGIAAVTFGTSASSSIAAGGTQGAAIDPLGNPSPQSAVSYQLERGPNPPPPPPGGNPPPPPPPPTATQKFRTTFASFRVKSRTRYTGRIRSSGRGCKSGRRVVLKRNGRSIRSSATRGDGTFSIRRTRSTAGKRGVYAVVTLRTKRPTTCTARKSKTLRRG